MLKIEKIIEQEPKVLKVQQVQQDWMEHKVRAMFSRNSRSIYFS
jgi:hypothetical protein